MSTAQHPPLGGGLDEPGRALFTDLYQLTMLQAYAEHGLTAPATFELFARSLPANRSYLLACGLDDALTYLEGLRFGDEALAALERSGRFPSSFLDWLGALRFTGDVYAMPEGTPAFGGEPLLTVEAPLPEAQLAETYLLNQLHLQTLIASKGARIIEAARGRPVVDFGTRRAHGTDAALKAARALYLAGMAATSNVLAADRYGIPATGTMAHSYVQAHDDESEAFRSFVATHPDTVLLVDTYDTAEGVRRVARLAAELGDAFRVRAVRLDSEPLAELAREARAILDAAGLERVEIVASGGLDETRIAELVAAARRSTPSAWGRAPCPRPTRPPSTPSTSWPPTTAGGGSSSRRRRRRCRAASRSSASATPAASRAATSSRAPTSASTASHCSSP